jgi:hypothetical protein
MKPVFVVLASAALAAQAAQMKITPADVAQIDLGKLNGSIVRELAWSPDNTQLYLQTINEDKQRLPKDYYHYVIPAAGGELKKVSAAPEWASQYWTWKSAQTAPDDVSFKIEISQDKRVQSPVAIPMGGDLAKGGSTSTTSGASVESVTAAANASTNSTVYDMHLKGEIVGEWVDHAIVPGLTFGWGPKGSHVIAYADKGGHLVIMDSTGDKQKIDDTKNVVLPAFTADGTRLAYLEGRGRNKYALVVASVTK